MVMLGLGGEFEGGCFDGCGRLVFGGYVGWLYEVRLVGVLVVVV